MLTFPDFKEKQIVFINQSVKKKIHFANDNLVLKDSKSNQIINRVSCYKIFAIFLVGDISLTSVFLRKSQRYGFSIVFLTRSFGFYGLLGSQTEGNFLLRSKQYAKQADLPLAQQIIKNKIGNQISLLKNIRIKKDIHRENILVLTHYQGQVKVATDFKILLGIEGYASKVFFQTYFAEANWQSRKPRTKIDELNLLMDIGYTFLFNIIECHLRLYGFDIYRGFYHTLFYERKSLVCDLIEPFRCIIDRALYKAYNLKQIDLQDFGKRNGQFYLKYPNINKYATILFESIIKQENEIFQYIQGYYRAFMKNKEASDFPVFDIQC